MSQLWPALQRLETVQNPDLGRIRQTSCVLSFCLPDPLGTRILTEMAYNVKVLEESRCKGPVPGVNRWKKTRAKIRTEYANEPRPVEAAVEKLDQCLNYARDAILEAGRAVTRHADYKLPSSRFLTLDAARYVP